VEKSSKDLADLKMSLQAENELAELKILTKRPQHSQRLHQIILLLQAGQGGWIFFQTRLCQTVYI